MTRHWKSKVAAACLALVGGSAGEILAQSQAPVTQASAVMEPEGMPVPFRSGRRVDPFTPAYQQSWTVVRSAGTMTRQPTVTPAHDAQVPIMVHKSGPKLWAKVVSVDPPPTVVTGPVESNVTDSKILESKVIESKVIETQIVEDNSSWIPAPPKSASEVAPAKIRLDTMPAPKDMSPRFEKSTTTPTAYPVRPTGVPTSKTDWQSVPQSGKTVWQSGPQSSKTDWQSVPQSKSTSSTTKKPEWQAVTQSKSAGTYTNPTAAGSSTRTSASQYTPPTRSTPAVAKRPVETTVRTEQPRVAQSAPQAEPIQRVSSTQRYNDIEYLKSLKRRWEQTQSAESKPDVINAVHSDESVKSR